MSDDKLIEELYNGRFATAADALNWCFRAADALAAKDTALAEAKAERDGMIARCRTAEADLELWQLQADNLRAELALVRKALEAEHALSALQLKMLGEAYLEIDAYRTAALASQAEDKSHD